MPEMPEFEPYADNATKSGTRILVTFFIVVFLLFIVLALGVLLAGHVNLG